MSAHKKAEHLSMKRSILKITDCVLSVWRLLTLKNVAPDEEPVVECFVPPTPWGRQPGKQGNQHTQNNCEKRWRALLLMYTGTAFPDPAVTAGSPGHLSWESFSPLPKHDNTRMRYELSSEARMQV